MLKTLLYFHTYYSTIHGNQDMGKSGHPWVNQWMKKTPIHLWANQVNEGHDEILFGHNSEIQSFVAAGIELENIMLT